LIPRFLQKGTKGLWLLIKLVGQVVINFEHMVQTVDCTVLRNCDDWSKSDCVNGQNESFILPSVRISSDPELDQVPNMSGISKSA
jgi:hypothetical protein